MTITINKFRNKFYICAGKSKLSKGHNSLIEAKNDYSDNHSLYNYWAGSCSVSIENSKHQVIEVL